MVSQQSIKDLASTKFKCLVFKNTLSKTRGIIQQMPLCIKLYINQSQIMLKKMQEKFCIKVQDLLLLQLKFHFGTKIQDSPFNLQYIIYSIDWIKSSIESDETLKPLITISDYTHSANQSKSQIFCNKQVSINVIATYQVIINKDVKRHYNDGIVNQMKKQIFNSFFKSRYFQQIQASVIINQCLVTMNLPKQRLIPNIKIFHNYKKINLMNLWPSSDQHYKCTFNQFQIKIMTRMSQHIASQVS
ncbi:unnamed protein product (macronuclear) [Paramecium tetraurelia]|uniref:Transmembrane protein n=1 Tax=Paramecium tetraurelia TaxID=5888 RepID=A0DPV2_PARTE|nr:uncharacterized protein GSPATT00039720001 [Paramecium tetraurelia]CAK85069.1 unnamed protein product [Paramecium tetraurelia]|eukprot:XP_001452466.1 hypothetical protein (macronuclear) [Paramecium tetraurelia strain d4-2]